MKIKGKPVTDGQIREIVLLLKRTQDGTTDKPLTSEVAQAIIDGSVEEKFGISKDHWDLVREFYLKVFNLDISGEEMPEIPEGPWDDYTPMFFPSEITAQKILSHVTSKLPQDTPEAFIQQKNGSEIKETTINDPIYRCFWVQDKPTCMSHTNTCPFGVNGWTDFKMEVLYRTFMHWCRSLIQDKHGVFVSNRLKGGTRLIVRQDDFTLPFRFELSSLPDKGDPLLVFYGRKIKRIEVS